CAATWIAARFRPRFTTRHWAGSIAILRASGSQNIQATIAMKRSTPSSVTFEQPVFQPPIACGSATCGHCCEELSSRHRPSAAAAQAAPIAAGHARFRGSLRISRRLLSLQWRQELHLEVLLVGAELLRPVVARSPAVLGHLLFVSQLLLELVELTARRDFGSA